MFTKLWNKLTQKQMKAFLAGVRYGAMLMAILLFMWGCMRFNPVLSLLPIGFLLVVLGATSEE